MGEMTSLRSLNVRRNLLVELPKEISQLKLVNFDCTSNRISKLPLCFREMVTLIDLLVENNPLEVPPAHVILDYIYFFNNKNNLSKKKTKKIGIDW